MRLIYLLILILLILINVVNCDDSFWSKIPIIGSFFASSDIASSSSSSSDIVSSSSSSSAAAAASSLTVPTSSTPASLIVPTSSSSKSSSSSSSSSIVPSSSSSSSSKSSSTTTTSKAPIVPSQSLRHNNNNNKVNNNNNNNKVNNTNSHIQLVKSSLPSQNKQDLAFKHFSESKTLKHSKRSSNAAIIPQKHTYDEVLQRRTEFIIRKYGSCSKLVIIGDSVIERFHKNITIWKQLEEPYCAINLASAGDCTEHVLHRFENGKHLTNITNSPLVIVMIGTNNLALGDQPSSVLNGIKEVVKSIKTYIQGSKILLLSLLPRTNAELSAKVMSINKQLSESFPKNENVTFIDVSTLYLSNDTKTPNSNLYLSDRLHPNAIGTHILFKSIENHILGLPKSKYVPSPISTPKKLAVQPTRPLSRNNTISSMPKINSTNLPAGTLSVTKFPPGQGIGDFHPKQQPLHLKPRPLVPKSPPSVPKLLQKHVQQQEKMNT